MLGDYETPSLWECVCLSYFYFNLYISFIYEDIFTKFAENVYGYENMSLKYFVLILKKNMATMAECSKIIENVNGYESLPESNFGLVLKTKWLPYHIFNVK